MEERAERGRWKGLAEARGARGGAKGQGSRLQQGLPGRLVRRRHRAASMGTSCRTRSGRTKHEAVQVYAVKAAQTSTLTRIHERWPAHGSHRPSWKLARTCHAPSGVEVEVVGVEVEVVGGVEGLEVRLAR